MSHPHEEEVYTTFLKDVLATAEEFGRVVVDLEKYGQIIVLDDHIIGEGFVKQFEWTPLGFVCARRWCVRMDDADEEISMSFEELRAERLKQIQYPQV